MQQMRVVIRKRAKRLGGTAGWLAPGLRLCTFDIRSLFGEDMDDADKATLIIGSRPRAGARRICIYINSNRIRPAGCTYTRDDQSRSCSKAMYLEVGQWIHKHIRPITKRRQTVVLYVSVELT